MTSGMYNRLKYLLAWGRAARSCKSQCWRVLLLVQSNPMEYVSIKLAQVQHFDSKEEKHGIFREHPLCYFWSLIQVTSVLVLTSAWQFKSLKAYRYPIVAAVINSVEQVKARICWLCLAMRMHCMSCSTLSCKNLQLWDESMCLDRTEIDSPSKLNTSKKNSYC